MLKKKNHALLFQRMWAFMLITSNEYSSLEASDVVGIIVRYVLFWHQIARMSQLNLVETQRQAFVQLNFEVELFIRFSFIWLSRICINELCYCLYIISDINISLWNKYLF